MNNDKKILQITSGRGPIECCWVVAQVLKFLIEDLKAHGISYLVLDREEGTEHNTLISATVQIEGQNLIAFTDKWVGSVLWIGQSTFRKMHKRKNWFVGVNLLEIPPDLKTVQDADIAYQSIRSGGPGGQHVNKVSTAVRTTHIPTGIAVLASDHKSQLQNKKAAKERLVAKLNLQSILKMQKLAKTSWQNHNELERGNPVKVFRGSDFKTRHVKDKNKSDRAEQKRKLKNRNVDFDDSD